MNELATQSTSSIIPTDGMAAGLAILFDDRLYVKIKAVANIMAGGRGITPPHLVGQPEACFAVITRSITWKLDPFFVSAATYATPGGKIGFEGKLVHAILENSGRFEGEIAFTEIGDWSKVQGKWKTAKSQKGKEYAVPAWKPEDEEGLGVIVSATVKGENQPREMPFMLKDAYPRNAVTWATRPAQQIKAPAIRAFANTVVPGIFAGLPADPNDSGGGMIEVNERPPSMEMSPQEKSGPINYVQMGFDAYMDGVPFRDAPGHLPAEAFDDWGKGWQQASKEDHGEESEPDTLQSADKGDAQPPAESGDEGEGSGAVSRGKEKPAQDERPAPRSLNEMLEACGKNVQQKSRVRHAHDAAKKGLAAFEDFYKEQFPPDQALLNGFLDELREIAAGT